MRKPAILVIATVLATAYAGADASERAHHRHAAGPAKAAPHEPATNPMTRVPVPADTFRA
jgi:hypothetical protein